MRPVEAIESGNRFASVWPFVRKEGFTLGELIIVVSIIAVLLAAVALTLPGYISRGETTACQADQRSLLSAASAYRTKAGAWPTDGGTPDKVIKWDADDGTGTTFVPDFVQEIPRSDSYCEWKIDGSGDVVPNTPGTCPCE